MVALIPASAFAGVRFDCVSSFSADSCSSIDAKMLGAITPTAFSGFTEYCIGVIPTASFTTLQADQLAALDPMACGGFWSQQVMNFPVNASLGLSSSCLSNFTTSSALNSTSTACFGLTPAFVSYMPPSSFTGFTRQCIFRTAADAFEYLSSDQVQQIPAPAFGGFVNQLNVVADSTIASVGLDQLLALPDYSKLGGLTAEHLVIVTNKFGLALIDGWTVYQTFTYSPDNVYGEDFNAINNFTKNTLIDCISVQAVDPKQCQLRHFLE